MLELASDATRQRPSRSEALAALRTLIAYIGDDPDRAGLRDTPERVLRAWEHTWGCGYHHDPTAHIRLFADAPYDQLVCVTEIAFTSHCEHHLVPFYGTCSVGYFPEAGKGVVGLSKLVRIVQHYAAKLQVQERLTNEIADFLSAHISGLGVGVIMRATHMCMVSRGVKQATSTTLTSAMRGVLLDDQAARTEFLSLAKA